MAWSTCATAKTPGYKYTINVGRSSGTSRCRGDHTRHRQMVYRCRAGARLCRWPFLKIRTKRECMLSIKTTPELRLSIGRPDGFYRVSAAVWGIFRVNLIRLTASPWTQRETCMSRKTGAGEFRGSPLFDDGGQEGESFAELPESGAWLEL